MNMSNFFNDKKVSVLNPAYTPYKSSIYSNCLVISQTLQSAAAFLFPMILFRDFDIK